MVHCLDRIAALIKVTRCVCTCTCACDTQVHVVALQVTTTSAYWVTRKRGSRISGSRNTDHDFDTESHAIIVIIFHSAWEPVSKSHFKMAGVCKWAISVTEAYFMDDTRLVGNRMIG